ncbi:hypothetical protein CEE45_10585 [Candidatus Heimdallarchaeota archaeon B3_Heim]|nr:MAG: hypothetical protein CEE45_10585 [Candidatus Heimdallarchaeota archaeon B3_Heim]
MKAMILRIGIDKGTDGTLAPIFNDRSYEYIPMSERDNKSTEPRKYSNTKGRSGKLLSYYLPKRVKDRTIHFDPEFETMTYGDPTIKRKYLLRLAKDDLLVFYAGLTPFRTKRFKEGLFIIGYFLVSEVVEFKVLTMEEIKSTYNRLHNNAHAKRSYHASELVIVTGSSSSRLLERAIPISSTKMNSIGRKYHVVSPKIEKLLGIKGSIQRSIPPRFIYDIKNISNLRTILSESQL